MPHTPTKFTEYLTVSQAAEFLGVSPWTLRNWDKAGKLRPVRHPKNSYRIYRQQDLQAVLALKDDAAATIRATGRAAPPGQDWSAVAAGEHFVQFYEDENYLAESVGAYVAAALRAGDAAVIVATPEHRAAIEASPAMAAVDPAAAAGRYVAADAARTLASFMVGPLPDPGLFERAVLPVIERLSAGGTRRVRAFGEMVGLLWDVGNRDGAIRLEQLWDDLARRHGFSLFCAYPLAGFAGGDDADPFEQVCACHARVIPAESYAKLATPDERAREVSRLQRKARALDAIGIR